MLGHPRAARALDQGPRQLRVRSGAAQQVLAEGREPRLLAEDRARLRRARACARSCARTARSARCPARCSCCYPPLRDLRRRAVARARRALHARAVRARARLPVRPAAQGARATRTSSSRTTTSCCAGRPTTRPSPARSSTRRTSSPASPTRSTPRRCGPRTCSSASTSSSATGSGRARAAARARRARTRARRARWRARPRRHDLAALGALFARARRRVRRGSSCPRTRGARLPAGRADRASRGAAARAARAQPRSSSSSRGRRARRAPRRSARGAGELRDAAPRRCARAFAEERATRWSRPSRSWRRPSTAGAWRCARSRRRAPSTSRFLAEARVASPACRRASSSAATPSRRSASSSSSATRRGRVWRLRSRARSPTTRTCAWWRSTRRGDLVEETAGGARGPRARCSAAARSALFTSLRRMRDVRERLAERLRGEGFDLLMPRRAHRRSGRAGRALRARGRRRVLLGSRTFWQGLDIPGPALSGRGDREAALRGADRAAPAPRGARCAPQGSDAFERDTLGKMLLNLKQMVGPPDPQRGRPRRRRDRRAAPRPALLRAPRRGAAAGLRCAPGDARRAGRAAGRGRRVAAPGACPGSVSGCRGRTGRGTHGVLARSVGGDPGRLERASASRRRSGSPSRA